MQQNSEEVVARQDHVAYDSAMHGSIDIDIHADDDVEGQLG